MLLSQAIRIFLRQHFKSKTHAEKTVTAYKGDLTDFANFCAPGSSLNNVTTATIEVWIAQLRKTERSPATIKRKLAALRLFSAYWTDRGELDQSPFWRLKIDLQRTPVNTTTVRPKQLTALINHARERYDSARLQISRKRTNIETKRLYIALRNLTLIEILRYTGIRVAELTSLNVKDVRITQKRLRIVGTRHTRLVPVLNPSTVDRIRQYLKIREEFLLHPDEALFLNAARGRLSAQGVQNAIDLSSRSRAPKDARITPRLLRNSLEQELMAQDIDLPTIAQILDKTYVPKRLPSRLSSIRLQREISKIKLPAP